MSNKSLVLFTLATLCAVAHARPGYLGPSVYYTADVPSYAKVGTIIKSIPTAVSHHSQSIVHSSAHVVQPILTPIVKTTAYIAPQPSVGHAAPIWNTYAAGWNAWSPTW